MTFADDMLRLFGTNEPPRAMRRLQAGALSCDFEGGTVRRLRWGDTEIVRGLAYLLRDRNWGRASAQVVDVNVQ